MKAGSVGRRRPAAAAPPGLATPVTQLKGVGGRVAEGLARLGIRRIQDLLFHLPLRYQDRTRVMPLGALRPGMEAVVEGVVELSQLRFGRRRSLLTRLADGTGALTLRFFHFSRAQQEGLVAGLRLRCFGEVRPGPSGLEMVHPEYQRVAPGDPLAETASLTPIYPTTEGLHQLSLRKLTAQALACLDDDGPAELLPEALLVEMGMPPLIQALREVHRPPPGTDLQSLADGRHPAQQRLAFEELLAHQLSLRRLRQRVQKHRAPAIHDRGMLRRRLLQSLPFELTSAQRRVIDEVLADLRRPNPMLRLLQGDVGSGKTVVAAACAAAAVESKLQVAVMAPTELLAEQHQRNLGRWLAPLGVAMVFLGGKLKGRQRAEALAALAEGRAALAVGTHALFQEDVRFHHLGLVVVDEQHRFGVHQRLALRDKGRRSDELPHQLIMTATPIPRTLAMTAYADLDSSVLDELPADRKPVTTVVLPDSRRDEVVARIAAACAAGRQVYWVCTLIEESEALQCQAATETAAALGEALPGVRVGLVHGRMKAEDKERVMGTFQTGAIDLLVATTVIEVGVDVPNASLMVIENAERLGLAQLHQLRGRVGRGTVKSDCLLMYHPPLGELARARLAVLRETGDGFVIAQRDLELRGPGELLGTRQAGLLQLHIADLSRDRHLLDAVSRSAERLLRDHPDRVDPLVQRWLGDALHYGSV